MDNTLVSARISKAKKDASADVLRQIGASTSDLIVSAFDYLLEMGELPKPNEKTRNPSDFQCFVDRASIDVDWNDGVSDYKKAIKDWRLLDYESLA